MGVLKVALQIVGTVFFLAGGFNKNIDGTSSIGLGAACWSISFFL